MKKTYFRMFPLLSEALALNPQACGESWMPEESLGFCSIFEIFPRLGIQVAVEVMYRLQSNP